MEGTKDFFKTHALRTKNRSRQRAIRMKLSIEAKVAAAVAIAFAALSIGAIAQEGTEHANARLSQTGLQKSEISLAVQNGSSEHHLLAQYFDCGATALCRRASGLATTSPRLDTARRLQRAVALTKRLARFFSKLGFVRRPSVNEAIPGTLQEGGASFQTTHWTVVLARATRTQRNPFELSVAR